MAKILLAPDNDYPFTKGEVLDWHRRAGDVVAAGDLLTGVHQAKARWWIEVRAPRAGTLLEIIAPTGSIVQPGEPLAILGEPTEALPPLVRVLRQDGTLGPGSDLGLRVDELLGLYLNMWRARLLDKWLSIFARDGRVARHLGAAGEEASVLGSAFAMRDSDWIFPGHREFAAALQRGMPLQRYLDHMVGNDNDLTRGRPGPDHFTWRSGRIVSVGSRLDARVTQAVGVALAAKRRRDDVAALVYLGDGLTRAGEFHSGMNFAGVFKAPVIFFGRTNLGTKNTEVPCSVDSFAHAGLAYGIPGVRVDGNDLFAVIEVTRAALARAVRGEGPTLIEALTHRVGDAPTDDPADVMVQRPLDPRVRLRRYLERTTGWHGRDDHYLELDVRFDFFNAHDVALSTPSPAVGTLFDDVYQEPPWHLVEQRDELLRGPRAAPTRKMPFIPTSRSRTSEQNIRDRLDAIARRHFVMTFPFERVLARHREDHPDFTGDLGLHERELKRYLWLCAEHPRERWPMFAPLDDLWHTLLLFTSDYHRLCTTAAKRYIHHEPSRGDEGREEARAAYARFIEQYTQEFNEPPPPEVWPSLPGPPDCVQVPCLDNCASGGFP